jgi:glutamate carboxypeptidase
MGVRGEFNHTQKEYAIVDTLFERSKLLATAVLKINEFENQSFMKRKY